MHAQVQQMRFAGRNRHDPVTRDGAGDVEYQAVITREQAIAENTEAPGILIRRPLDGRDRLEVGRLHQANLGSWMNGGAHGDRLNSSLTRQRSVHAVALASGVRSKYAG